MPIFSFNKKIQHNSMVNQVGMRKSQKYIKMISPTTRRQI